MDGAVARLPRRAPDVAAGVQICAAVTEALKRGVEAITPDLASRH